MPRAQASQATKRQRTDADYLQIIRSLPAENVHNILVHAAQQHQDVAESVVNERKKIVEAKQVKTLNFDFCSVFAWNALNVTFNRGSGSEQSESAFEAAAEIEKYIGKIRKSTPKHASLDTKKSALETLLKIGNTIVMGTDTVGRKVRVQFQHDTCLEDTMLGIAKRMTRAERKALMTPAFDERLTELERLSKGYCVFEKLRDVRLTLHGAWLTAYVSRKMKMSTRRMRTRRMTSSERMETINLEGS
ncbi:unnamed protein product [Calypogeia fissa]